MSNVFEYCGIPERKGNKVVQLVKNHEEVPKSKVKYPLLAQVKKDGVFALVVSDGEDSKVFGRTGKALTNAGHLCFGYPPGVFIGELCLAGHSLEVLSGIVNPNRTKPVEGELYQQWLQGSRIWLHDYISMRELTCGQSEIPYRERYDTLRRICTSKDVVPSLYLEDAQEVEDYAAAAVADGEEGIVLKNPDAPWVAGHKGWHATKIVRQVEYDLLCVGVEEGTGKYAGKVANLILRWRDGNTIKAMLGKFWSHSDAEAMWEVRVRAGHDLNPIGRVYRVYGLQDSSKGKIRLPKVGELRIDKDEADY